jgi:hypothetical protein
LKAVCKYCRLQLYTKSGTSSLRGHIADSCPIIGEDVRKQFVSTMKKQPLEGSFVFDPQVSRERLVDFCIHVEIPFNKFEDSYCQPFNKFLMSDCLISANAHGLPPKHGIYIDIPNRWNVTFKMLREALSYKSALHSYAN